MSESKNWFQTLNDSLESMGILEYWDCFWDSISYGENRTFYFEREGKIYHASIYRENNGLYERPIVYCTLGKKGI